MPFDALGRTRATMMNSMRNHGNAPYIPFSKEFTGNLLNVHQAGDRSLELLVLNEEFLVSASHQLALITSLPFVHTARRSYRLDDPVKMMDRKDTLFFLENI